jgi:putative ABC transport system permease protein
MIKDEHITYISRDLHYRGIVEEHVQSEMLDHLCELVDANMNSGLRFIDAYERALNSLGYTDGLLKTQAQIIRSENPNAVIMLNNYITVAWRNLSRHKSFTLINVFGLAVGLAACLLITLFISDEFVYDKFNKNADRIFRVDAHAKIGVNQFDMTYRSAPEAEDLARAFPEIEKTVRFRQLGSYLVKTAEGNQNIKESRVIWTDSTFFQVFSVPVLEGNAVTALAEPQGVAISKHVAEKYYPGKSALGETIILDNVRYGKVTAVFQEMPATSHFHFDIIIGFNGDWPMAREAASADYLTENFVTYLLLRPDADARALDSKLPDFVRQHVGPALSRAMGADFTFDKFLSQGNAYNLSLRPLLDIHLHSNLKGEFEPNGSTAYVYLIGSIGLIILLIACINFINLSTARSSTRAKEVGVRKAMGSLRIHLVRQFLTESLMIASGAFVCALLIAWLALPYFNGLAQRSLTIPWMSFPFMAIVIASTTVIAVAAGLYPALVLSAFKPSKVLKGERLPGSGISTFRSILVVGQLALAVLFTIGAVAIMQQLHYIQQKNPGFDKEQVVIVHDAYALRPSHVSTFKEEVLRLKGIVHGTISGFVPVEIENAWRNNNTFWEEGKSPSGEHVVTFQRWSGDHDYISTFGMELIAGRDFSRDVRSDEHSVIINESAVRQLGMKDPIGKRIIKFDVGAKGQENEVRWTIIGVIRDFHFTTMKETISPLGIFLDDTDGSVSFRLESQHNREVIAEMEAIWKKLAPGQPFNYSFLDEDFNNMYKAENRLASIFAIFSGLAIAIACLGLFALASFTAQQRTREIGIRKALGASIQNILVLLVGQFGKLVLVAFVVSAPVAHYVVNQWLSAYAYKTEIKPWLYLIAGGWIAVVTLLTVLFQSIRAAKANPVNALRSE